MEFSFFTTDNKSGYKTTEKWFSKNYIEEYNKIMEYCNNIDIKLSFKEKIFFYYKKLKERPKCLTCGGEIKFRERFDKPYGDFCSLKCINDNKNEMIKRQKQSFQKKYKIDFYPQHKDFIKKQKKTKKEKYGNENFNNINKIKQTKKEKYGNENFNNTEKYKSTCLKKYNTDNYSKSSYYKNFIVKKYKNLYSDINFININKTNLIIKCNVCYNDYEITKQLLYERYKRGYIPCTICNSIGQSQKSGYEIEISEFLDELNIEHLTSDRKTLEGQELDIYIPQNKIAIEFDGLYWHNELFCDQNYHIEKTKKCNEKDIELIHLFEDEWVYKKEIVKSILRNKLNLIKNKIYARKCIIKEINNTDSKEFLDKNHIQGNVKSKVRIGLYYNNELVSLMTFSKGRIIMGGKENEWELNRFCNKLNTNIIGASSKLFNYFLKHYNANKIISYSDIRIFNGKMYEKIGFKKIHQSNPNYWYVINGMRYYRFNFRKSILVKEGYDKNKTEKEIMFERKIYRIYDCGNIRWEFLLDK